METEIWKGVTIKVVGIGGAGSNAVDRMIQIGIPGVDFVAVNTDAQALARSEASHKIQLGAELTRSLGAGGDPVIGARAAYESREELGEVLHGADMVFIAAGMGGGTGTGAAPIVAQIAQAAGALTIAVVTKPFSFEGSKRLVIAEEGVAHLRDEVDTLIVVPNDRLLSFVDKRISLDIAFRIADEALRQGVQGISELVTRPGLINLDFADVRSIMGGAGGALISIGHGEGKGKTIEATRRALASPLLDIESIGGTEGILVNITGGDDLTLAEVSQAMEVISQAAIPQAKILFGAVIDPAMEGRVEITLIATGVGKGKTIAPSPAEHPAGHPADASAEHPPERPALAEVLNPPQPDRLALAEVLGDDLAVPAFMRSRTVRAHQRVRLEELRVV